MGVYYGSCGDFHCGERLVCEHTEHGCLVLHPTGHVACTADTYIYEMLVIESEVPICQASTDIAHSLCVGSAPGGREYSNH